MLYLIISGAIRGLQLIWTIINLGLAAGLIADLDYGYSRVVYSLVISVLTIIYLVVVMLPICFRLMSPLVILVCECIFMIFWLASFAAMANAFGDVDCTYFNRYYDTNRWCLLGKAMIAFGLFNWVTFCVSLILLIIFTVIPFGYRDNNLMTRNTFKMGAIFPEVVPSKATQDVENPVGATSNEMAPGASGESKEVDKVESPATPTDEATP
ncbi:unnamed protein product [Debaryomyces tyrocola]|nr:unnamed protein product [Debaryomyces tyrocola]